MTPDLKQRAREQTCRTCGETKPLSGYQPQSLRCRVCLNKILAKQRATPEFRQRRRLYLKEHRKTGAPKLRERRHAKNYVQKYPEKAAAKSAVKVAIESGKLVRPTICPSCGANNPKRQDGRTLIQAHHKDYTRPLDVEWLCIDCHSKEHRALKQESP